MNVMCQPGAWSTSGPRADRTSLDQRAGFESLPRRVPFSSQYWVDMVLLIILAIELKSMVIIPDCPPSRRMQRSQQARAVLGYFD